MLQRSSDLLCGRRGLAVAVLVAGIIVRLILLVRRGEFWMDEAINVYLSNLPIADYPGRFSAGMNSIQNRFHPYPPLYSSLLHLWRYFGESELWCRSLSLLFGIASMVLLWRTAERFLSKPASLLTLIIAAFSPTMILFSLEAKSYGVFIFLTIASTHAFLNLVSVRRGWLAYTALTTLCLYTHYYTLFILAAQNLTFGILVVKAREKSLPWAWIISQTAILLIFLPWGQILYTQVMHLNQVGTSQASGFYYFRSLSSLISMMVGYLLVAPLPDSLLHAYRVLLGVITFAGLLRLWKSKPNVALGLSTCLFLPFLLHALVAYVPYPRYFVFLEPFLILSLAQGLSAGDTLRSTVRRGIAVLVTFLTVGFYLLGASAFFADRPVNPDKFMQTMIYSEAPRGEPWSKLRDESRALMEAADDQAVVVQREKWFPSLWYYFDAPKDLFGVPDMKDRASIIGDPALDHWAELLARRFDRVWLATIGPPEKSRILRWPEMDPTSILQEVQVFESTACLLQLFKVRDVEPMNSAQPLDLSRGSTQLVDPFPTLMDVEAGRSQTTTIDVSKAGSGRLCVIARARMASPFRCRMLLHVDRRRVAKWSVGAEFYYPFCIVMEFSEGAHEVSVVFEPDP